MKKNVFNTEGSRMCGWYQRNNGGHKFVMFLFFSFLTRPQVRTSLFAFLLHSPIGSAGSAPKYVA